MSQLIPTPYSVIHITQRINMNGPHDRHGNDQYVVGAPVVRKAQSINQYGGLYGSSSQIYNPETFDRDETQLSMAVPNPDVYESGDRVVIWPEFDQDGDYIAGSGYAYFVDGQPTDDRKGPWVRYLKQMGGVVKLRRVT